MKQKVPPFFIGFVISLSTSILIYWKAYQENKPKYKPGMAIILNGSSSVEKKLIQKEFQILMIPSIWIKLDTDTLFNAPMLDIVLENSVFQQTDLDEQKEKIAYSINSTIAGYVRSGCNVIVDYSAYKPELVKDLQKKLKGLKSYWVKVHFPVNELEKSKSACSDIPYDLVISIDTDNAADRAHKIKNNLSV